MKTIIILVLITFCTIYQGKSQPIADTLQWLKTNIEQRSHLFSGKPLGVLLDSLKDLKNEIREYSGPRWYAVGNLNDTVWVKGIDLSFEKIIGSEKDFRHQEVFFSNNMNDTLNTHIKILKIEFAWPVPFLRKWWSYDRKGLGSYAWNAKLEAFWKEAYVLSVKVEEY